MFEPCALQAYSDEKEYPVVIDSFMILFLLVSGELEYRIFIKCSRD